MPKTLPGYTVCEWCDEDKDEPIMRYHQQMYHHPSCHAAWLRYIRVRQAFEGLSYAEACVLWEMVSETLK